MFTFDEALAHLVQQELQTRNRATEEFAGDVGNSRLARDIAVKMIDAIIDDYSVNNFRTALLEIFINALLLGVATGVKMEKPNVD